MALSFLYFAFVRLLQVIRLRGQDRADLAIEVVMLRHQVAVLRRQIARPALRPADRALLAGLGKLLERRRLGRFFVQPGTLLRWHSDLVRRRWTYSRPPGRPRVPAGTVALVVRLTAHPTGTWVTQQARQLAWTLVERAIPARFLVRDRDAKFTVGFDMVFRSEGVRVIRTPIRAPRANAFAERFVGTVRLECLDRILIFGRRQLDSVLIEFVDHYNTHRRHRSLGQASPLALVPTSLATFDPAKVRRRDRLGGLIHEYQVMA